MTASWKARSRWIVAAAIGIALSLGTGGSLDSAEPKASPRFPDIDPAAVAYQHPDQIKWTGKEGEDEEWEEEEW